MSKRFVPALQRTQNFFELYQYICGKSEVPTVYHFWASVSLMAAVLENNVWFEKFKGEELYPHLYICLIGPGGLGKGMAISQAARLAKQSVQMSSYRGKLTAAHLTDVLGKVEKDDYGRKVIPNPRLWLIMDELKNDVGSNKQLVEEFIAMMTEIYTASNYQINTGTRTSGKVDIENPIMNWLFGSTEAWLKLVLTKDIVDSGFTSRACFIFGEHDFNIRCPRIVYPPDYEEVFEHLKMRLWALQQTRGRIMMTPDAEAMQDKWYMTRPNPEDEALFATWRRQHDLMLKFAMLACLADGGPAVIRTVHFTRAKAMVASINRYAAKLLEVAHETFDTKPSNDVESYIKAKKTVDHSTALRYFRARKGMNAKKFKEAVWNLVQEGSVKANRTEKGGIVYEWIG